jgi:integration host factor subunit beta
VIKSQLVLNVASQFLHIRSRVVGKAINVVIDEIVTAMARKDRVELRGFGAFSVKDRAGRIGRNPRSGVKVEVPEKSVPVLRPSKEIGRRLNHVAPIPKPSERTSRRSR